MEEYRPGKQKWKKLKSRIGPRYFENKGFFIWPKFHQNKLINCDFRKIRLGGTGPPPKWYAEISSKYFPNWKNIKNPKKNSKIILFS